VSDDDDVNVSLLLTAEDVSLRVFQKAQSSRARPFLSLTYPMLTVFVVLTDVS